MRVALDTNVMAYAEGVGDAQRRVLALDLVAKLSPSDTFLPLQTLGELFNVLVRKGGRSRSDARASIIKWQDDFQVIETSISILLGAMDLATDHRIGIWDSVILSATAHGGCRLLLSEDLQDGFTWNGATVANPFATPTHPLLQALLIGSSS